MAPTDHQLHGSWAEAVLAVPSTHLVASALLLTAVIYLTLIVVRAALSPLQRLPGPSSSNFLFGDFPLAMRSEPGTVYENWVKEYGTTVRCNMGILSAPAVVTTDLTAIGYLQRNADLFIKPPQEARLLGRLTGDGVLMAEFHDHRRQRRILNPAFSAGAVREMTPIFYSKAYELCDRLTTLIEEDPAKEASPTPPMPEDIVPGARKIDMGRFLTELAFDVIGLAGFDYNFKCLQSPNPIVQTFREAVSRSMDFDFIAILQHFFPIFEFIPTKRLQVADESRNGLINIGTEFVAEKKRAIFDTDGKDGESAKDILSLIVKANLASDLPHNQRLSDAEIIDQVATFLLAGSETSSNAMSWCLWRLAQNQPLQKRLRAELETVGSNEPSLDELSNLTLLENVIRETLRLDPPVPDTMREATADAVLPLAEPVTLSDGSVHTSLPIAKGQIVVEPFMVVHRLPEIWGPDAAEFNPDRYERPNCPAVKIPGSYGNLLSFNGGARNCIGYRFALAQMKIALFVLIRNFNFEILPSAPEILRRSFVVMLPWVAGEEEVGSQMPLLVRPVY